MPVQSLEQVPWETCLLTPTRDDAMESYARAKMGMPLPMIRYFSSLPWLSHAMVDLHPEYGLLMSLELELNDLIQLVVSQENSCRFCYAAVRAMLRIQGMSEDRIRSVEGSLTRADVSPREAAALAFARALTRSTPAAASAAKQALLHTGVSVADMKEIAFVASVINFTNRAATTPAIPPYSIEQMPRKLHFRFLRPFIARMLRKARSRGQATPLDSGLSYPYAGLVESFAGSPIAPALAKALAEMWASPVLTRRCKLLLFAVIARGLRFGDCVDGKATAVMIDVFV